MALLPDELAARRRSGPRLWTRPSRGGEAPPLGPCRMPPTADLVAPDSRAGEGWAEWLLEAARLLAEDGIAVVGLAERGALRAAHRTTTWDESRIGMTVLDAMKETPNRSSSTRSGGSGRIGAARSRESSCWNATGCGTCSSGSLSVGITAEELERPAEDDEREVAAASANAGYLRSQLDLLAKRHRHSSPSCGRRPAAS